jgi:hypothetical protein
MMVKSHGRKTGHREGHPGIGDCRKLADDIVMIVFYTVFLSIESGGTVSWVSFLNIPLSIFSGIGVGIGIGFLVLISSSKVHLRDSLKLVILVRQWALGLSGSKII